MANKYDNALDEVLERFISVARPIYRNNALRWIDEAGKIKSYKQHNRLKPSDIKIDSDLKKLLNVFFQITALMGNAFYKDQMEESTSFSNAIEFFNFAIVSEIDWETIPFEQAIELMSEKEVIPPDVFKEMLDEGKPILFSVQRIEEMNAINIIKQSLLDSMKTGIVFRDWYNIALPDAFRAAGYTNVEPLARWHAEVVLRTNQSSIYNVSRWENMQSDNNVEGIRYRAVIDSRTRKDHADLNGLVAKKDDPIWDEIYPPNGYNCRCDAVPITIQEAKREKIQYIPKDAPIRKEAKDKVSKDFTGKNTWLGLNDKLKRHLSQLAKKQNLIVKEINELILAEIN